MPLAFDQADDTSDTAVVCLSSRSTSVKLSVPDVASGVDEPVVLVSSGTVTISAEDVITGRSLVPVSTTVTVCAAELALVAPLSSLTLTS